ncbi:MAG: hypothetical protein ACOX40_05305 [Bacilli bacterium]|jgi:hypothetical protein|nr:hypothetical protein [Acholeplasmataceae bacterium]
MNCFNHSPKEFGFKRQHDDCDFKHFDKAILGLSFLGGLLIGALFGRRSCCYPSCSTFTPYSYSYPMYY